MKTNRKHTILCIEDIIVIQMHQGVYEFYKPEGALL